MQGRLTTRWTAVAMALAAVTGHALAGADPAPMSAAEGNRMAELVRLASELRADEYAREREAAEVRLRHAESADCHPARRQKVARYQDVLASGDRLARHAATAAAGNPGKAAMLYAQASRLVRGITQGEDAAPCGLAR